MLIFNAAGFVILSVAFLLDPCKAARAIRRGLSMLWKVVPEMLVVLALISLSLAFIRPDQLRGWLSSGSLEHFLIALLVGAVALMPGFIAYPLARVMLKNGASVQVVAGFITTLMMVGVVTLPLEARYLGWKTALLRNALSFVGAVVVALGMGCVL
ncbi:MAG: permease [Armatimonadota bacterium]|nr:permease [Armatimonadota bacterium]